MAKTAQQIVESTLGQLHIQVCSLQALLDDANEKIEALQKALDEATAPPKFKRAEPRPFRDDAIEESTG